MPDLRGSTGAFGYRCNHDFGPTSRALKRIGANHFALIGAVGPVSVAVTSALGLDEPFTWLQALGGLLVISGVLLVSVRRG